MNNSDAAKMWCPYMASKTPTDVPPLSVTPAIDTCLTTRCVMWQPTTPNTGDCGLKADQLAPTARQAMGIRPTSGTGLRST